MPRTKQQFEQMRNATRDSIQNAALQLFARQGFGSTNVQQIADKAGISVGLLYRHYKTKEALFAELADFSAAGLERIIRLFASDQPPRELLDLFIGEVHRDLSTSDDLAHLIMLMTPLTSPADPVGAPHPFVRLHERLLEATAELIRKGQRRGELRPGAADELALMLFAAIQGLAMMRLALGERFRMPSEDVFTAFLYR